MSVLLFRLVYLQLYHYQFYANLSHQNIITVVPIPAKRGLIFDRHGVLLADNIPTYTLAIIPRGSKNLTKTLHELNKLISLNQSTLNRFYRTRHQYRPYQPVPLKFRLTEEEVATFYVNRHRFPGVFIQTRMIRYYPKGALTSNIVGYVGHISATELRKVDSDNYVLDSDIGKMGIEKYYEKELHGKMGSAKLEIDANGRIIRQLTEVPPQDGNNIYLTVDSHLQQIATQALEQESGAVALLIPKSGEVLALATQPTYDPNLFVEGLSKDSYQKLVLSPLHPLYNRAIQGQFAAGSTIKPFLGLMSLDNNIVSLQDQIYDPGWFQLANTTHIYHDWKDKGHGWVNLTKAIIVSCDVFFYNLAVKLGIHKISDILTQFGFGQLTQIDLPEEVSGLVPTAQWKTHTQDRSWYTGDTIETAIGQGFLLVTPLQLGNAISIVATRGIKNRPHLLLKMISPDQQTSFFTPKNLSPIELKNKTHWETIINAMRGVVDNPNGTASYFGPHNFSVAAKTGTAQIYGKRRDEDTTRTNIPKQLRNNHLFTAFAPVNDPQIAIAVVVEHSAMADKISGDIMRFYFKHSANDS